MAIERLVLCLFSANMRYKLFVNKWYVNNNFSRSATFYFMTIKIKFQSFLAIQPDNFKASCNSVLTVAFLASLYYKINLRIFTEDKFACYYDEEKWDIR